jgi:DNA-binding SARP family transcriptional activator/LysM repeat protein
MNPTSRITRALGALALLGLLVVGIPWALAHYIGSPLPHDIPGWQQIHDTLTNRGIPDDVLLNALAIVVWITWAMLVASLVTEAIGMARGTSARRVPLASSFQPLARWLVAAIAVGILTTSSRTTATPTPALAASLTALRTNTPRAELVVDLSAVPPATPAAPSNGAAATSQPAAYVVQPGDTLWDIAGQHLGDPYRWPEIYDLNHGRPQPDGTSLSDPNLIYPGWTLQLPLIAPPTAKTAQTAAPALPTPAPTLAPPAPVQPVPDTAVVPPATVALNGSTETTLPTTAPATIPSSPSTQHPPTVTEPATANPAKDDSDGTAAPFGVAGAVLLAGGSTGLLALLRRRQLQRRTVGHAVPRLTDELAATETTLRVAALGAPGPWLDVAFRTLAGHQIKAGEAAAQPVAAHLTSDELVVMLAEPNPRAPTPWATTAPGWRWHLPLSTPTGELERTAADACAPMPALITIGNSPDGPVMLDLEACGIVTISGTPDQVQGLARSATLELAVSPVADELDIVTVGDVPLVAPTATLTRVQHTCTVDEAIAIIGGPAQATAKALKDAALATTFQARCTNHGSDPWSPTILILNYLPDENERTQLEALVGAGGRGLGILAIGDWPNAPWPLHIAEAHLDAPRLGLYGLDPTVESQHVERTVADATVQLFEQTDDDTDEPLIQYDAVDAAPPPEEGPAPAVVDAPITVHVCGPVYVDGATRPLTDLETELVAFLATRERPVDADVIQTALWPDRTVSAKRWWNLVSETRKALGVDDEGSFHLPPFTRWQPLRLVSGVTTDLARIEAALQSVRNTANAEAVQELAGALDGVTGRPFDAKRGYTWTHANGLASFAEALITDAAHALAAARIERGDVDEAVRVTTIGLRASPGNEILYRDLIIAHDQAGDMRAVENTMRDLLAALETADPYADLQPETLTLYERVSGRARSKADDERQVERVRPNLR